MSMLSHNLRKWRDVRALTDAEIARRANLSPSRYAHYVAGNREPDMATLVRIARVLGVTPNALLGVTDHQSPSPTTARIIAALETLDGDDLELAGDVIEMLAARAAKRRSA